MDVRVITLRYQEGIQGFPEGALKAATAGREVLEARGRGKQRECILSAFA